MTREAHHIPVSEWTDPRHVLGIAGEEAARDELVRRGWHIEAHRFRAGRHDIDLVIRLGTLVAFVEVKTRSTGQFGSGVESIGWKKRRALVWAATVWMARFGRPGDRYRFDVVTVRAGKGGEFLEYLPDAWRP